MRAPKHLRLACRRNAHLFIVLKPGVYGFPGSTQKLGKFRQLIAKPIMCDA
jgi:hypothetical protein